MNYPEYLKVGDTIGICAPSDGIADEVKIRKLELAEKQLTELGYKVIETDHVRTSIKGRSADAETRAKEFMDLYLNDEVKLIICATGGDFMLEMIPYIDFDLLKTAKPKWVQGYSDVTSIIFLLTSMLDIPTMHAQTIKDYAMRPLFKNLTDALDLMSGKEVVQYSFEKYEKEWQDTTYENMEDQYNMTEPVEWKNLNGEEKISISGRLLGGNIEIIKDIIGTKYDHINKYISRHKEDGIIWFIDIFELTTPELIRTFFVFKNSGYLDNCKGIIIGRPLFLREDYEINLKEALKVSLSDTNIPVIFDADIGHVSPQFSLINGSYVDIFSSEGKGYIKTYLK